MARRDADTEFGLFDLANSEWSALRDMHERDRYVSFSPADSATSAADRDLIIRRSLGEDDEFQLVIVRQPEGREKALASTRRVRDGR